MNARADAIAGGECPKVKSKEWRTPYGWTDDGVLAVFNEYDMVVCDWNWIVNSGHRSSGGKRRRKMDMHGWEQSSVPRK